MLEIKDWRPDLGQTGKIHVRFGKGSRGRGPRVRLVPLINEARPVLQWYVEDVWSCFGLDADAPSAQLTFGKRTDELLWLLNLLHVVVR